MAVRKRSLIRLSSVMFALCLTVFSIGEAAAVDLSPELRQHIIDAGMAPWNGGMVSVDETLRGQNRERVSLRQFVGNPILAYN